MREDSRQTKGVATNAPFGEQAPHAVRRQHHRTPHPECTLLTMPLPLACDPGPLACPLEWDFLKFNGDAFPYHLAAMMKLLLVKLAYFSRWIPTDSYLSE